jgi:hypothetical protein
MNKCVMIQHLFARSSFFQWIMEIAIVVKQKVLE